MRQVGTGVGDRIDVEELRAGNVARVVLGQRIAVLRRQVPRSVEHLDAIEVVGQPGGFNKGVGIGVGHGIGPLYATVSAVGALATEAGIPTPQRGEGREGVSDNQGQTKCRPLQ